MAIFKFKRRFYNFCEDATGSKRLRQHKKTVAAFQKLADEQAGHDILIIPAQFGFRHRGCSIRRALEAMDDVEFGLGAFAVGCMLLTHPERLVKWKQLQVYCAGDEFASDTEFSYAPEFYHNGELNFDYIWKQDIYPWSSSASAFLSP